MGLSAPLVCNFCSKGNEITYVEQEWVTIPLSFAPNLEICLKMKFLNDRAMGGIVDLMKRSERYFQRSEIAGRKGQFVRFQVHHSLVNETHL